MNTSKFAYLSHASDVNRIPQAYKDAIIVLKDENQLYANGTIIGIGKTAYTSLVGQINNLFDESLKFVTGKEIEPISSEFGYSIGVTTVIA